MNEVPISLLSNLGIIGFVALSAYFVLLAGEVSFGQQAFFGLGAYGAALATAIWQWPLAAALGFGALMGATAACLIGVPTLRLRGIHFAVATLAFAEVVRLLFELWRYEVVIDGASVGPKGVEGFGGIRYLLEHGLDPAGTLMLIWGLLASTVAALVALDCTRAGLALRAVGEDPELADQVGLPATTLRLSAVTLAGALAATGGGLYAHFTTYIEPSLFNVMLGVHAIAYGLIGGIATPIGPLLGVAIDFLFLEVSRAFGGYRMIAFGGLVLVLLAFRPRGLIDEDVVRWISSKIGVLRHGRRLRSS
jgi:branched-chain amino acid transport system permease protein